MTYDILTILLQVVLGIVLLLVATVVFDIIHVLLHYFYQSKSSFLKRIGALHEVHHEFLDRDLKIHEDKIKGNVYCHVIPEYITQLIVTLGFALFLPPIVVGTALFLETLTFALILRGTPGFDVNHHYVEKLGAYTPRAFCMPEYHLLHHVYPDAYFGSWLKLIDYLLGTGIYLKGRHILISGTETPFGARLSKLLEKEGCKVQPLSMNNSSEAIHDQMQNAEILVLSHKPGENRGYEALAKQFCEIHKERHTPVEVWALTSNKEISSQALYDEEYKHEAEFAPLARFLFGSERAVYRHIVADGSSTKEEVALPIFKRIKRGYNYVVDSWSLTQLAHFIQFIFLKKPGLKSL